MPQDQLLLTILGVAVLANVVLIASSLVGARRSRRFVSEPTGRSDPPPARTDPRDDDAHAAAAAEAFVAGVAADAAGLAHLPTPAEVLARRRQAAGGPVLVAVDRPRPSIVAVRDTISLDPGPEADGVVDRVTWDRVIGDEAARSARFGRPSMVVVATLPQLDDLADRWGRDAADRVVTETRRLLVAESRAVDRIAWLGDARFGILLPETDGAGAAGYAGRVRVLAERWFESAGLSIRLDCGWSSLGEAGDGTSATAGAERPMQAAARR